MTQDSSFIEIRRLHCNAYHISSSIQLFCDTEKVIEIATTELMMDTKLPKLEVLNMILGRYQSQRRLEEAVIVLRLAKREQSKDNSHYKKRKNC